MKSIVKGLVPAILGSLLTFAIVKFFGDPSQERTILYQGDSASLKSNSYQASYNYGSLPEFDFSAPAESVTPAVVHIKSISKKSPGYGGNSKTLPFFDDFFGNRYKQYHSDPMPRESRGSGVIISEDGFIVTNNHVISGADEVEVTLFDRRTYKAKVIGTDPSTDLAVIQIKEESLPFLAFGNSDNIKVGAWVLAVGNPFNLESTVTAGIVSAKGRNISILRDSVAIESFIQTDAAVNPGNSGGALVNLGGQLIGINTAIATPTGSYTGYSFAVPSNLVRKVVDDLLRFGKVQRALLGISIQNVDGKLAADKGFDFSEGVYVNNVRENSSADDAGVKEGDVILKVNSKETKSVPELQEAIARKRPGDKVSLTIYRDGKTKTVEASLKSIEGLTEVAKEENNEVLNMLGARFEDLSREKRKELEIEGGIKVKKLFPGKLRSQTDIKEGFIITKVNKEIVKSSEEFLEIIENEKGGVLIEGVYEDYPGTFYYGFGLDD